MRRQNISSLIVGSIEENIGMINTIAIAMITSIDNSSMMCSIKLIDIPLMYGTRDEVEEIENVPIMPMFWGNACKVNAPLSVGDKVIIGFCQHDTFNARNSNAPVEPESTAMFDINNAIVIGQLTNDSTSNIHTDAFYILYGGNEIKVSSGSVDITAPIINLNGNTTINGNLDVSQTVTATTDVIGGGKSLKDHTNGGQKVD